MRNMASPGPDSLNAAFYKSAWSWIQKDVHQMVTDFYTTAHMPVDINKTFITLVPKKNNPSIPQNYRPISLCNVCYKIISKSLANRIKNHLPLSIDNAQAAFVPNKHISSNIIITQEIIHSFNLKTWNQHAFILKIDLAKALNRLEWSVIKQALRRLDFNDHFINLIYACISSPSFTVLVNGDPSNSFTPQRGIRQGCPLSPYLFVIAINELSIRLQYAFEDSNLTGITLGPNCLPIHSLLFADDLILCGRATAAEATTIKTILYDFYNLSCQIPNLQKSSILFSKNVPVHIKSNIKAIFPVPDLLPNTMHLGHPMIFSHRNRNKAYDFIFNKFMAKFCTVKANKLNHAGRLNYIQSVLASIPIYYMSTVLFSKTFVEKINTIIRRFWWACIKEEDS